MKKERHFGGKGQGSFAGGLIGIMIAVIIGVAVTLNVVNSVISTADFNGTLGTIVGYFPLLIAVVILVAIVGMAGFGA